MASRWRLSLPLSAPTFAALEVRRYATALIGSPARFSRRDMASSPCTLRFVTRVTGGPSDTNKKPLKRSSVPLLNTGGNRENPSGSSGRISWRCEPS